MVKASNQTEKILQGLSPAEVEGSRAKYGNNFLTPPKRTSMWKLYLDKYRDPIIIILLVAAAISLVLGIVSKEFTETIGIILAIFFATTVGFYFERDAAKKFDLLNTVSEWQPVKVRRDSQVMEVPLCDVVVGDIILVETGDEIPADAILLKGVNLEVNESSLTGEPIVEKHVGVERSNPEATYPSNRLLKSTMVMSGRGEAQVTAVGDATEIGRVARKSTEATHTKTPLNIQLDKLAKLISKVGSGVAIAAFALFLGRDLLMNPTLWHSGNYLAMAQAVLQYFMMAVTLIVMAVPEGLPMAVTLALALNMRRMLKSHNLVRRLHACETMGAVDVICTDKTGTLTQNKMQVAKMDAHDLDDMQLSILYSGIAVNTTAELNGDDGIGNPTEVALLLWLKDNGMSYRSLRNDCSVVAQLPFSTERKFMATVAEVDDRRWLFVKGAPEIVADFCAISASERQYLRSQLLSYQQKGMRTLGFACKELGDELPDLNHIEAGSMQWQAVAAISDPVRGDVAAAVNQCHRAGIEVKIVTGDTSATAIEIGRQIGVWKDNTPADAAISGPEWEALSDEEAYKRAPVIKVMSRAKPTDKQRLVEMLQKRGKVVAVTGDGTNDAPALHYAHVGLSLGSGTNVAKQASDMTLLDDSFTSIANAVMWGRSLYKNIQRFLFFQLTVNVCALLVALAGPFIGSDMPLTVTQILWVNLIMDTFAALALASLPPSREVMREKPRRPDESIITPAMTRAIVGCGILFALLLCVLLWHCEHGADPGVQPRELTIFFTIFVMMQFWNLFNAKALGSCHSAFRRFWADHGMALVLVLILVGQVLIVEFGGSIFRTVPLSFHDWMLCIAVTLPVLIVGELWRACKRLKVRREKQ